MAKKKVCKRCKMFVEADECPTCQTSSFTQTWQGRLIITDPENSLIAKNVGIQKKGEYAIKVR